MAHLRPLENSEIDDQFILDKFEHYANTRGFTPNSIRCHGAAARDSQGFYGAKPGSAL